MNTVVVASSRTLAAAPDTGILNALTVDVEDYFQVSAFAQHIDVSAWGTM
jgi:hypothetical protein